MITPVAGRRLAKSWLLDEALPYALEFYRQREAEQNTSFYFSKKINRLLKNQEEVERFEKRKNEPAFSNYLGTYTPPHGLKPATQDDLGSFIIEQGGYLDVKHFLQRTRQWLLEKEAYLSHSIDYAAIQTEASSVQIGAHLAKRIIFCEGWKAQHNPWFNWLPFNAAKGDILTIQSKQPLLQNVLNKRTWILPLNEKHTLKLGATYTRDTLDNIPQPEAKAQLLKQFQTLVPHASDYEVTQHEAGVRPLTKDNRPFIGAHPKHKNIYIFNGFGSKGTLFIPYLAQHFVEHLETGSTLFKEADINRVPYPAT